MKQTEIDRELRKRPASVIIRRAGQEPNRAPGPLLKHWALLPGSSAQAFARSSEEGLSYGLAAIQQLIKANNG